MATGRLNTPTVMVACGGQAGGLAASRISLAGWTGISDNAIRDPLAGRLLVVLMRAAPDSAIVKLGAESRASLNSYLTQLTP